MDQIEFDQTLVDIAAKVDEIKATKAAQRGPLDKEAFALINGLNRTMLTAAQDAKLNEIVRMYLDVVG